MMDLGVSFCLCSKFDCELCFLNSKCFVFNKGKVKEFLYLKLKKVVFKKLCY